MKKIQVGIDISKEKCNLCYRSGLEAVREEECANEARALKKAIRYADKAVRYAVPDAALSSMNSLLPDREFLLVDRKRCQAQLSGQKRYMAPGDYRRKSARWKKVIRTIDEQITSIGAEIDALITADPELTRQKELLVSIDGIGERIAVNMSPLPVASPASGTHVSSAASRGEQNASVRCSRTAPLPANSSNVHLFPHKCFVL